MSEQLTFWPYWKQKFGEFEISSFAEHSVAPRDFNIEGWSLVSRNVLSEEDIQFLEVGMLFNRTFDENTGYMTIERNYDDST